MPSFWNKDPLMNRQRVVLTARVARDGDDPTEFPECTRNCTRGEEHSQENES